MIHLLPDICTRCVPRSILIGENIKMSIELSILHSIRITQNKFRNLRIRGFFRNMARLCSLLQPRTVCCIPLFRIT
ncbi:hypothetical protein KC19_VG094400 [Ceratodon purpureus]|uniref:Uncharacterized protein n=1 Tax=Ceratodon purpureus TaxID=3225 RepID=A0A8T0HPA2_CERPU|nr:hypothetical protein KC19_VG094400 [Ceratodon purpureus]